MAGHEVARRCFHELRIDPFAGARDERRAAGMEGAAGRQRPGVGRLTTDDGSKACPIGRVRLGHGREERTGVGVERPGHELGGGRQLHEPARVHDRDALREVARAREIVGDVEDGEVLLRLELVEEVEDLGPAGGVDHGDGLVGHEVVRPQDHGPRDADALPLPARERVRELLGHLGRGPQLDLLQRRQHPPASLGGIGRSVDDEWLLHDLPHPHEWAEAGEGVLEDDLGALAETQQRATGELGDVVALEDDATAGERHQPQAGAAQRRLAAARFADQRHGLAARQLQRDVAHRVDGAALPEGAAHGEVDAHRFDAQDRVGDRRLAHGVPRARDGRSRRVPSDRMSRPSALARCERACRPAVRAEAGPVRPR